MDAKSKKDGTKDGTWAVIFVALLWAGLMLILAGLLEKAFANGWDDSTVECCARNSACCANVCGPPPSCIPAYTAITLGGGVRFFANDKIMLGEDTAAAYARLSLCRDFLMNEVLEKEGG